jgi:hypothetical protein
MANDPDRELLRVQVADDVHVIAVESRRRPNRFGAELTFRIGGRDFAPEGEPLAREDAELLLQIATLAQVRASGRS